MGGNQTKWQFMKKENVEVTTCSTLTANAMETLCL